MVATVAGVATVAIVATTVGAGAGGVTFVMTTGDVAENWVFNKIDFRNSNLTPSSKSIGLAIEAPPLIFARRGRDLELLARRTCLELFVGRGSLVLRARTYSIKYSDRRRVKRNDVLLNNILK